jgi:hypothetical protein
METEATERFKQSASTSLLIAFLSPIANARDYRVINFAELSEVAHADVQHGKRYCLSRAILRVWKDQSALFISVRDVGIKLGTDAEVSSLGPAALRHVHRTARVTREKLTLTNLEKLSNSQRLSHLASDALLGLQEQATRGIVQKRLEAAFEKTGPKSLEADELLRLSGVKQID